MTCDYHKLQTIVRTGRLLAPRLLRGQNPLMPVGVSANWLICKGCSIIRPLLVVWDELAHENLRL